MIAPTAAPIAISIKLASLIFPGVPRLNAAGLVQIGEVTGADEGGSRVTFYHPKSNMGILVELWQDV